MKIFNKDNFFENSEETIIATESIFYVFQNLEKKINNFCSQRNDKDKEENYKKEYLNKFREISTYFDLLELNNIEKWIQKLKEKSMTDDEKMEFIQL